MRTVIRILGWAAIAAAIAVAAPASHAAPRRQQQMMPPGIAPGTRIFVALAGRPAPVRVTWPPAQNIARYRARWSQAGALLDIELPGTATAFEREVSAGGRHQLTMVAIDATGRESSPVEIAVDVVVVAAIAPGSEEPAATPPGSAAVPGVPAFAVGARFRSKGLTCRLGNEPAAGEATAREVGTTTLHCGGGESGPRVEVPVVIAPVLVDAPKTPLTRGAATQIHITLASVARLGERLDVEADGGVQLSEVRRTEHGVDVVVTPRAGSAATAVLVVRSHGVQLGSVELALEDPPAAPPPPPSDPAGLAVDLGYHLGLFVPGSDPATLGASKKELTPRPLGGARVGVFPTRRVGLEAELALAAPDFRNEHRAWLLSTRAHLAVRVLDTGDLGVRLVGGAGTLNRTGAIHYGGAFTFETRRKLWLRVEALHAIAGGRDAGYTHCFEIQLGVVARLGRRDRWR
jgi:hypothetical protein